MRPLAPLLLLMAGASAAPNAGGADATLPRGQDSGDLLVYVAEEGDRLSELADRHFLRPEDWRKARALNGLRQDEIPAGTRLRLDAAWLKTSPLTSEVVAFRGEPVILRGGTELRVRRGAAVLEGDQILTGPVGFLTLRLSDGSELAIPTNSRVRILRLRGYQLGGMVDRRLLIERGTVDSKVVPMRRPGSRYEVRTPVSVAAVRGTEFRVSFTPGSARAITEVLEGRVGVMAVGASPPAERILPAGQGVVVTSAGVGVPEALLPPPIIEGQGARVEGRRLLLGVRREPSASALRLELATDAGFLDRVAELVSTDGSFEIGDLAPGLYHARLRAISPSGLAGRPATFTLRTGGSFAAIGDAPADGGGGADSDADADEVGRRAASLGERPPGIAGMVAQLAEAAEDLPPLLGEPEEMAEGDASDPMDLLLAVEGGGGAGVSAAAAWGPPGGMWRAGSVPSGRAAASWAPRSWASAGWGPGGGGGIGGFGWGHPGPGRPAPGWPASGGGGDLVPGALPQEAPQLPLLPSPAVALPAPFVPQAPGAGAPLSPGGGGAIPEARTWAMLIAGFLLVGLAARRRFADPGRAAGATG